MNLQKLIFTNCDAYKAGRKITPKGIMVHSTGANNPWLKRYVGPDDGLLGVNAYNNHWNNPNVGASVHAFIGKLKNGSIATYQVLPWEYRAGHCYQGVNGSGNNTHLAFEICEDGLNDRIYFNAVYKEAVELSAYLCKEFDLDPMEDGVVICHSEGYKMGIASNHADVMHWFPKHGKSMDTFRADVKALLNNKGEEVAEAQWYRVRKSWDDVKSQRGAYRNLDNAKKDCPTGYKVFDNDGNVVYEPEKNVAEFKTYLVRITASVLNVRAGAGTTYKVNTTVKKGEVYTIVEEKNGWGKLKSGAGWVSLKYCAKL